MNHREKSIFPSESRAVGTHTSRAFAVDGAKGLRLFVDVTNVGGGPGTVTVKVQIQDPVSKAWVDLPGGTTAALNAVSTKPLTIYPGIAETANESVSDVLQAAYRIVATVAVNAVIFSVGAQQIQ